MSTSIGPATPPNPDHNGSDRSGSPASRRRPRGGNAVPAEPRGDQTAGHHDDTVVARQKEMFGGIKIGAAFFGWLTATGAAVLFGVVATALGAAISAITGSDVVAGATENPEGAGLWGTIVLLIILLAAYYCGGYVAGRMARFNGLKQGLAVWLWAVAIAIVVAAIGVIAGSQLEIASQLPSASQLPLDPSELTGPAIIALVIAAVVALIGAMLGGLAGMRFHRKIDHAELD